MASNSHLGKALQLVHWLTTVGRWLLGVLALAVCATLLIHVLGGKHFGFEVSHRFGGDLHTFRTPLGYQATYRDRPINKAIGVRYDDGCLEFLTYKYLPSLKLGGEFFADSRLPAPEPLATEEPAAQVFRFCGVTVVRTGFAWGKAVLMQSDTGGTQVRVPVVYAIFLSAAISTALLWPRWKRRIAAGHCAKCGYDLRAHRPGQRCPECGTPIPLDETRHRLPGKDLKPPETDPPAEPLPPG